MDSLTPKPELVACKQKNWEIALKVLDKFLYERNTTKTVIDHVQNSPSEPDRNRTYPICQKKQIPPGIRICNQNNRSSTVAKVITRKGNHSYVPIQRCHTHIVRNPTSRDLIQKDSELFLGRVHLTLNERERDSETARITTLSNSPPQVWYSVNQPYRKTTHNRLQELIQEGSHRQTGVTKQEDTLEALNHQTEWIYLFWDESYFRLNIWSYTIHETKGGKLRQTSGAEPEKWGARIGGRRNRGHPGEHRKSIRSKIWP